MKISELRDKSDEELQALEKELRDQLVKLNVAKATQRLNDTSSIGKVRKDIARLKTVQVERVMTLSSKEAST